MKTILVPDHNKKLNLQDCFNIAWEWSKTHGRCSDEVRCYYRNEDNTNACLIGCLIPDSIIDKLGNMSLSASVASLLANKNVRYIFEKDFDHSTLYRLQACHDDYGRLLTEEEKLDISRLLIHHLDMDISIAFVERTLISLRDLNAMEIGIYYLYDAVNWITDMTVDCVIDHKMISQGTVVCTAKVHTSAAPYNRQALDKAVAVIKKEMAMACKLMFMPAIYFTSPIIASPHLPRNQ